MALNFRRLIDLARASPGELGLIFLAASAVVGGSLFIYSDAQPRAAQPVHHEIQKPEPKMIVVHVSGLVRNPGVLELQDGSRIHHAIAAAGGSLPEADLDSLNLASQLSDGQKIQVSKKGEVVHAPAEQPGGKTNLNTADIRELEDLPGVGPVLAQRILDFRDKHGRFSSVRDLLKVEGVGPKKFESLKDLVTV